MGNHLGRPCTDVPVEICGKPTSSHIGPRTTTSTTVYVERSTTEEIWITTKMDWTEIPDEDSWTPSTTWVTETTKAPAAEQTWTTILTPPTTTTTTTSLTSVTETVSEPATDQIWTTILTSPTITTTTTTLTPVTETVSGPTIDQTWTTILTSLTTTTVTTTLISVATTSEVLLDPPMRNEIGLSLGRFDFGLAAFMVIMILCGLGVIAFFVWLVAELLQSRPILVRRIVPVEVNDQGRGDFGHGRDISYEKI